MCGIRYVSCRGDDVECAVTECIANRNGECICPSLIKFGVDGKCKGRRK